MCEMDWKLLLEYLKVFLSWPTLVTALLAWFIHKFSSQISKLVENVTDIKLTGGNEVKIAQREQQQRSAPPPSLDLPVEAAREEHFAAATPAKPAVAEGIPSTLTPNFKYSDRAKELFPGVDTDKIVKWMHDNPGPSFDDYIDKSVQLVYEKAFNIIFGSQVQTLLYLEAKEAALAAGDLATFYQHHARASNGTHRTLNDFLGFLASQQFVTHSEGLYRITPIGKGFLQHIKQNYPLQWDSKPY